MTTVAIVGAGPGLGAAVARVFGGHGHAVALLARRQDRLDELAGDLTAQGIEAAGFATDVRDGSALTDALQRAADRLGPIEILQYSPIPASNFLQPLPETGAEALGEALAFSLFGPYAAVQSVLHGLRERGRGTILFVNGASAIRPNSRVAGTSIAFAAESAYAAMLHETLATDGVHVGQLIIPGGIAVGDPVYDPTLLAQRLWAMHTERGPFRVLAAPLAES